MVYNELCHKEIDWSKAMKQILIKIASLSLLFSVVSTYACSNCGCEHTAIDRLKTMETSKAGNGEDAKKRFTRGWTDPRIRAEEPYDENGDGKKEYGF